MEKKTDDGQKERGSKAVFWDFHGTLAYPKHLWGESVFAAARIACAPLPPPFSPADVKEYTKAGWYPWDRYEEDFSRTTGEKWWEFMCGHFCRIYKSLGLSEDTANRASLLVRDELTKAERYELYPDAIPALRSAVPWAGKMSFYPIICPNCPVFWSRSAAANTFRAGDFLFGGVRQAAAGDLRNCRERGGRSPRFASVGDNPPA